MVEFGGGLLGVEGGSVHRSMPYRRWLEWVSYCLGQQIRKTTSVGLLSHVWWVQVGLPSLWRMAKFWLNSFWKSFYCLLSVKLYQRNFFSCQLWWSHITKLKSLLIGLENDVSKDICLIEYHRWIFIQGFLSVVEMDIHTLIEWNSYR